MNTVFRLKANPIMKTKIRKLRFVLVCFSAVFLSSSLLETTNRDAIFCWGASKSVESTSEVQELLKENETQNSKDAGTSTGCFGTIHNGNVNLVGSTNLSLQHNPLLCQVNLTKQRGIEAIDLLQDRGKAPPKSPSKTTQKKSQSPELSIDSPLEAGIDRYIKNNRYRRRLASTDQTSFVVYDISKGKKVVSINEDRPMMAASLIKNFVMLVYFHEVRQGRLRHTNQNRLHLKNMIQRSYNSSTNYFIKLLGGPSRVNQLLRWNYPYFEHTRIVESIPNGGRTYRNMTSAHDMNRFYYQLWLGHLPHSPKMKHYLGLPKGDRLYDKTCIPRGVHVYNKTGTVYGMVGDSGILVITDPKGKQRAYILTGIIEDRTKTSLRNRSQSFGSWVRRRTEILRSVSEGVYEYIYERHYGGVYRCRQHRGRHLLARK